MVLRYYSALAFNLDTPRPLVQNARPRRAGRAVECTSLENWQGFAPFVSSNLTPSAKTFSIHAGCSVIVLHRSYRCSYRVTSLDVKNRHLSGLVWFFVTCHSCALFVEFLVCFECSSPSPEVFQINLHTAQPTTQQKAEGRRITSPVLLPLTAGDGS